jgi:hypothetical protein
LISRPAASCCKKPGAELVRKGIATFLIFDIARAGGETTMRTWDEKGHPDWVEPMTQEEVDERELWRWEPTVKIPFTSLPPGSDLTNLVAFPLLRRKMQQMVRLQMSDLVTLQD